MNIQFKPLLVSALAATLFFACGGTSTGVLSTPVENIDSMPLKVSELTHLGTFRFNNGHHPWNECQ